MSHDVKLITDWLKLTQMGVAVVSPKWLSLCCGPRSMDVRGDPVSSPNYTEENMRVIHFPLISALLIKPIKTIYTKIAANHTYSTTAEEIRCVFDDI